MATTKASTRKKTTTRRSRNQKLSENVNDVSYGEAVNKFLNRSMRKFSNWYENPTSKYIAAGVGLAVIVPIGVLLYRRYPKFGIFVRRNLDNLEDTLKEFRPEQTEETITEPHH